jgi:phytoene synthase
MDSSQLVDALPIERRLALSYAPGPARTATLALFALDAALGNLVRSAREPLLGQMRLAWWREQLGKPAAQRAQGEPVLALLGQVPELEQGLQCLVDGWEVLLGEAPIPGTELASFAAARGEACAALAIAVRAQGHADVARICGNEWALAELASRLSDPQEREFALELAGAANWQAVALPRSLRPLKVLHALAVRSKGHSPLLSRRTDILTAFRLGLLGI